MSSSGGPTLEVLLRSILDAKGFDELQTRLRQTTDGVKTQSAAHHEAADSADKFKEAMGGLGEQLIAAVGGMVLVEKSLEFFKGAIKDAIEASRTMNQFAMANQMAGQSGAEAAEKNKKWLESMEVASGIAKDKLVPGYIRLTTATDDVADAQRLAQAAIGASTRGLGDAETNMQSLAKWWTTGQVRATGLGLAIKKLTEEGLSNKEVLARLTQTYGDAGRGVHNAGIEVDRTNVMWKMTKERIGEASSGIVTLLRPALEWLSGALARLVASLSQFGAHLGELGSFVTGLFRTWEALLSGGFKEAKRVFSEEKKSFVEMWKETDKQAAASIKNITDVWKTGVEDLHKTNEKFNTEPKKQKDKVKELTDEYKRLIAQAELAATSQIDGLLRVAAVYKKLSTDVRADSTMKVEAASKEKKLLSEVAAILAKSYEERQKARLKEQDQEVKDNEKVLAEYRKAWDRKLVDAQKGYEKLHKLDSTYGETIAALYQQESNDFRIEQDKRTEYAEKAAEIRKQIADQEAAGQKAALDGVISFAKEAFGQSKEMAIAEALINTYLAIARALKDYAYPYSLVVAALAAATGFAQVAKIESTSAKASKSSGFDDPANDFAARVGGQKWAKDMVDHFSSGAMAGFSSQIQNVDNKQVLNQTTINEGARTAHWNINAAGLLDTANEVMMRRFARKLQVYSALEGERTLR